MDDGKQKVGKFNQGEGAKTILLNKTLKPSHRYQGERQAKHGE